MLGEADGFLVVDLNDHMGPQAQGTSVCEGPILGQQLQRPVAIGHVGAVGGRQDRDAGLAIGQGCLDLLNRQGRGQFLQMAIGGAGLDQGSEFLQGAWSCCLACCLDRKAEGQ